MFDYVIQLLTKIKETFNAVGNSLDDAITYMDSFVFAESSLSHGLSTFRWLVGDTVYTSLMIMLNISVAYSLFVLGTKIYEFVQREIPFGKFFFWKKF